MIGSLIYPQPWQVLFLNLPCNVFPYRCGHSCFCLCYSPISKEFVTPSCHGTCSMCYGTTLYPPYSPKTTKKKFLKVNEHSQIGVTRNVSFIEIWSQNIASANETSPKCCLLQTIIWMDACAGGLLREAYDLTFQVLTQPTILNVASSPKKMFWLGAPETNFKNGYVTDGRQEISNAQCFFGMDEMSGQI